MKIYWALFVSLTIIGIVKILMVYFKFEQGKKIVTSLSVGLSIIAVLFLAMAREPYEEPGVHMFFHKQTKEVEQVEKFVRSLSITIPAKYEDEIYKLYPTDIYYIETIDRRTYLYTASRVYQSSEKLLSLEKLLEAADKGNK